MSSICKQSAKYKGNRNANGVFCNTGHRLYQRVNVISLRPVTKAWALLYQFSQKS